MNFTGERFVPQLRGQIYYEHFHRYAVAITMAEGKDVLDIACGEGYGSALLATKARSVIGVDIDEASVRHGAARYPAMNLVFRNGSASQIPLADASVDLVVSFETIEHILEQEQMMREIVRVLRPDGQLIISSPNRLVYSDERGYANPFHVRELYFHEFRDLLRSFFPEVHMYGQRIFGACAIYPIDTSTAKTRWLSPSLQPEAGLGALPGSEYFVAACSLVPSARLASMASVYLDLRDDLLSYLRTTGLVSSDTAMHVLVGPRGDGERAALPPASGFSDNHGGARRLAIERADDINQTAEDVHAARERQLADFEKRLSASIAERIHVEEQYHLLEAELARVRGEFERMSTLARGAENEHSARERQLADFEKRLIESIDERLHVQTELDRVRGEFEGQLADFEKRVADQIQERLSAESAYATLTDEVERIRGDLLRAEEQARECEQRLRDEVHARVFAEGEVNRVVKVLSAERDAQKRRASLLAASLENTEESLFVMKQALEDAHRLNTEQREAIAGYHQNLELAESDRVVLRRELSAAKQAGAREGERARELARALARALTSADRLRSVASDALVVHRNAFDVLLAMVPRKSFAAAALPIHEDRAATESDPAAPRGWRNPLGRRARN